MVPEAVVIIVLTSVDLKRCLASVSMPLGMCCTIVLASDHDPRLTTSRHTIHAINRGSENNVQSTDRQSNHSTPYVNVHTVTINV